MKKYTSDEFVATQYGIYKAAQDIITSFPSTIIANGANVSAVIKGNMQQSGTPTPTTPIYPTECGDLETTGEHTGQYKIPILSNSTTTPVYLGEVESTRQIKQLVLTGNENWQKYAQASDRWLYFLSITAAVQNVVCSHCSYSDSIPDYTTIGVQVSSSLRSLLLNLGTVIGNNTKTDFKSYLAAQYAAGTPVTVWYVLATETTGIVNEPIRKIGTYADSVAAAAIPTTAGSQTFNIDTTLKPSEVDLTYTDWHMYDDKKYSGGEWG